MRRVSLVIFVLVALGSASAQADKNSTDARTLATEAIEISKTAGGEEAKVQQAIALFKQAYALDSNAAYRCSVGIGYQEIQKLARAHLYFSLCILETDEGPRKDRLIENLAVLEADLKAAGFVQVTLKSDPVGASLSIPDLDLDIQFAATRKVWLRPGEHLVRASLLDHIDKEQKIQVDSQPVTATISLEKQTSPATDVLTTKPKTSDQSTGKTPSPATQLTEPEPTRTKESRLLPWTLVGSSVAMGLGSVYFFTQALDARDAIKVDMPRGKSYTDLRSKVRRNEAISYSMGGVAIAAALVGAYLLVDSGAESEPSQGAGTIGLSPVLSPNEHGAVLLWSGTL